MKWLFLCLPPGGMQDYNYVFGGCMEITLELGCCKYPLAGTLEGHWNANRDALLTFLQQVHIGEYSSSDSTF